MLVNMLELSTSINIPHSLQIIFWLKFFEIKQMIGYILKRGTNCKWVKTIHISNWHGKITNQLNLANWASYKSQMLSIRLLIWFNSDLKMKQI